MMQIEPLTQQHLLSIELQDEQVNMLPAIESGAFYDNVVQGSSLPSFAALQDGVVMGCYGATLLWDNRAMAWVLLSKHVGKHMRQAVRMANQYLEALPVARLEAYIRADFNAGHQWARLLGFDPEGLMRCFFSDGQDAYMYARVKDGA